jgi:hypothetical protein
VEKTKMWEGMKRFYREQESKKENERKGVEVEKGTTAYYNRMNKEKE